ncbi:MAG: chromate efflux transporter [Bauldia sp.]
MAATGDAFPETGRAAPLAIFAVFTRLGLTSFGGPIAHLGYFRQEFVVRRRWLGEAAYADLVALCQFLPGPASSQVGFAIGAARGGLWGALAAWLGFTWPSAVAMVLFAYGATRLDGPLATGVLHGLMLVVVGVVAQAVIGMARTMCPDAPRAAIAALAAVIVFLAGSALGQIAAIALGAAAGMAIARGTPPAASPNGHRDPLPAPVSARDGGILLAVVPLLLIALWLAESLGIGGHAVALVSAFYRSGALVFGGGHVVLPMLDQAVVATGWVPAADFLAGYGAAQAVPGPLFSFAAFLGAVGPPPNGWPGAILALFAIFLPGLLLVLGALPYWEAVRRMARARAALAGVNAAVVGILAAALYDPLWTGAVHAAADAALALAFLGLLLLRLPPWLVVLLGVAVGAAGAGL